jgi:hypothetical protein
MQTKLFRMTCFLRSLLASRRALVIAVALLNTLTPHVASADEAITHTFRIGPLLLRIPESYVQFGNVRKNAPNQGIVLIIRWPSMEGYYLPDGGLPSRETNRQPVLNVSYIYDGSATPNSEDLASRFRIMDNVFHLVAVPDDVPGLRHYQATVPHMPGIDYYFSTDDKINILIHCDAPERTLPPLRPPQTPGCTYDYRNDGFALTIGFRKEYLPQWMEIKEKTETLLHSFIIGKNQDKKE